MSKFHIPYAKIKVLKYSTDTLESKKMKELYFNEMETYNKNDVDEGGQLVIKDLQEHRVEVRAVRYYDPPLLEFWNRSRILGFIVNITTDAYTRIYYIPKENLEVTPWGQNIVENGEEAVRCYNEWRKELSGGMYVVSPTIEVVQFN